MGYTIKLPQVTLLFLNKIIIQTLYEQIRQFNIKELEDYCYRVSFIDRGMEVSLAHEFKDISQRIKLALDSFNI